MKIKSFTDLIAWRKSHELVLRVYKITCCFPREERYALIDQIRRAVVSISSNIAEGFSRRTYIEKNRFYYMAQGSLTEVQNLLLIARDLGYLDNNIFKDMAERTVEVHKLINSLVKKSVSILNS